MQELIRLVTQRIGIGEGQARKAIGGALRFLSTRLEPEEYQRILDQVPGARDLAGENAGPVRGGGWLGGALSALGGGGSTGDLLGMLLDSGMDAEQLKRFVPLVGRYLQQESGVDLESRIRGRDQDLFGSFLGRLS